MSNFAKDFLKSRVTRIQSLANRISEANNFINELLPNEQEGQEPKELSSQKLMKKLNTMLQELQTIQNKLQSVKNEEIASEVNALPERSLIELAVSKAKQKEELLNSQSEMKTRDEQFKNLELEFIAQRQELEEKKKENEQNRVLIESLQQQIAVLRSKSFGYDVGKKYEYYKDKQRKVVSNIEDENLAFAMWEKENYDNRRSNINNNLEKLENSKRMWISGNNNTNKVVRDVDVANSYNNINSIKSSMNDPYSNNNYKGNLNQNISTNMRKYTPMLFKSN